MANILNDLMNNGQKSDYVDLRHLANFSIWPIFTIGQLRIMPYPPSNIRLGWKRPAKDRHSSL
jgi:hypothetical protein